MIPPLLCHLVQGKQHRAAAAVAMRGHGRVRCQRASRQDAQRTRQSQSALRFIFRFRTSALAMHCCCIVASLHADRCGLALLLATAQAELHPRKTGMECDARYRAVLLWRSSSPGSFATSRAGSRCVAAAERAERWADVFGRLPWYHVSAACRRTRAMFLFLSPTADSHRRPAWPGAGRSSSSRPRVPTR